MSFKFTKRTIVLKFIHNRSLRVLDSITFWVSICRSKSPTFNTPISLRTIEKMGNSPSIQIRQTFSLVSPMTVRIGEVIGMLVVAELSMIGWLLFITVNICLSTFYLCEDRAVRRRSVNLLETYLSPMRSFHSSSPCSSLNTKNPLIHFGKVIEISVT